MAPILSSSHRRAARRCAAGVGAALLACASTAAAQCADTRIDVTGRFAPDWAEAITAACARMHDLPDRDPAARLSLTPEPGTQAVHVRVVLDDGRTAVRVARVPEELARVMEALVTLPPAAAPAMATATATATTPAAATAPRGATAVPAAAIPLPKAPAPPHDDTADVSAEGAATVAFDVTVLSTVRVLGAPAHVAFGVVASGDVDIDRGWIVGLRARVDAAVIDVEDSGDLDAATFGGGLELARRVSVADVAAIDLGLGADALVDVPVVDGRGQRDADDARGDLRARAFTKLWLSGRGTSFCALLGFELSPVRVAGDDSLPAIGGELGVGIGWGAL